MNYRVCFVAYLKKQGRQASTIRSYEKVLQEFAWFCQSWGRRPGWVKQLNPKRLEAYKSFLLDKRGLRPSTVNRRLSALSAFARFLISRGVLTGNPLDLVSRVGKPQVRIEDRLIAWEGVQQLLAEVHRDVLNVRDRALVELLYAGLTVRELCSLKYDGNWTADNNTLIVGDRAVTLHARACLALEHYMILRPILRGDHLFAGKGPSCSLKHASAYGMVRRLARLVGVKIGVKDLRRARYAAEVFEFEPAFPQTVAA